MRLPFVFGMGRNAPSSPQDFGQEHLRILSEALSGSIEMTFHLLKQEINSNYTQDPLRKSGLPVG